MLERMITKFFTHYLMQSDLARYDLLERFHRVLLGKYDVAILEQGNRIARCLAEKGRDYVLDARKLTIASAKSLNLKQPRTFL